MSKVKIYRALFGCVLLLCATGAKCFADVSAQLEQARKYVEAGNWRAGAAIYQQIADANPGSDDGLKAMEKLTLLYVHEECGSEARAAYERLMAEYADHEGLIGVLDKELASAFKDWAMYETAVEIYEHIMASGPSAEQVFRAKCGLFKSYLGLGDEAKADAALAEVLTELGERGGGADIIFDLAYDCRGIKKWKHSRRLFEYFLKRWPSDERTMRCQRFSAKASIFLGDDPNAEAAIEKLFTLYSDKPKAAAEVRELADDYVQLRDYGKAAGLYRRVVEHWKGQPGAMEAQVRLARMYVHIGDYEKADAAAAELIEFFSGVEGIAGAVEDVADKYQMAGSQDKSYPLHRYVVQHWPQDERAIWCQMKAVNSRIAALDLAAAEAELGNLLTDFAGHEKLADVVHEVVEEYRDAGLYEEGRGLFAYLLENWDETPETMLEFQVGVALQSVKLRELDKADAAVEKLIADYNDHPELGKALFQIGEEHFYANNYGETIELLELIESKYPTSQFSNKKEIPYVLASCYNRLDENDKAIRYYKETIERYPNSRYASRAPYRIGMIYMMEKEEYEKALYWFEEQRVRYEDRVLGSRALFHIGTIYSQQFQEYGKAAEVFEEYVEEYPNGGRLCASLSNLALCYERLGDKEEAKRILLHLLDKSAGEDRRGYIMARISRLEEGGAE